MIPLYARARDHKLPRDYDCSKTCAQTSPVQRSPHPALELLVVLHRWQRMLLFRGWFVDVYLDLSHVHYDGPIWSPFPMPLCLER